MVDNLILCKYGKHETEINNFNPSGLRGPYNICRSCQNERKQKNRDKHREAFNEHHKMYQRMIRKKKCNILLDEYQEASISIQ
ncbi:MAG: hypothetical protein Harvfovirus41_12 [Harvfovirus sp.]|uniref:Uncharacterized protein n=1 Tax=Harvfovirus sp. TaxID=2487768 RepID=A0A3G5A2W1_9VIRU|nr:MAG: hypothetical protein Harvfovirus41_12 [Harvfovirus sp.]